MVPGTRWALAAIWVCFLLRALSYCSIVPLWEAYDEYSHFSWIQYFDSNRSLPDGRRSNSSREVQESLRLAPMPWTQRDVRQDVTHDAWWRLPAAEREDRERRLRAIPPAWASKTPQDVTIGLLFLLATVTVVAMRFRHDH